MIQWCLWSPDADSSFVALYRYSIQRIISMLYHQEVFHLHKTLFLLIIQIKIEFAGSIKWERIQGRAWIWVFLFVVDWPYPWAVEIVRTYLTVTLKLQLLSAKCPSAALGCWLGPVPRCQLWFRWCWENLIFQGGPWMNVIYMDARNFILYWGNLFLHINHWI